MSNIEISKKSNSTSAQQSTPAQSALRWNHAALDELCRRLPEFGACLMVVEDPRAFDFIWRQSSIGLVPNAAAVQLRTLCSKWDPVSTEDLSAEIQHSFTDLLVLRAEQTDLAHLDLLCSQASSIPCSLIVVARAVPRAWKSAFDVLVVLTSGTAMIVSRLETEKPVKVSCALGESDLETSTAGHAPLNAAVITLGVSPETTDQLAKATGREVLALDGDAIIAQAAKACLPCSLLVVSAAIDHPSVRDAIRRQSEGGGQWIALGSGLQRDRDRPKMYLAGARTVLHREAGVEEIVAAVRSAMPGFTPNLSYASAWDGEAEQLLARIPKAKVWSGQEAKQATIAYQALIHHQLRHAVEMGTSMGGLIVEMPAIPAELAGSGWSKLCEGAMLGLLSGVLRKGDFSFMVEGMLVIISPNMSPLASRAILKRMQSLMPVSDSENNWRIVEAPTPDGSGKAAQLLLESVFKAASDGQKLGKEGPGREIRHLSLEPALSGSRSSRARSPSCTWPAMAS